MAIYKRGLLGPIMATWSPLDTPSFKIPAASRSVSSAAIRYVQVRQIPRSLARKAKPSGNDFALVKKAPTSVQGAPFLHGAPLPFVELPVGIGSESTEFIYPTASPGRLEYGWAVIVLRRSLALGSQVRQPAFRRPLSPEQVSLNAVRRSIQKRH